MSRTNPGAIEQTNSEVDGFPSDILLAVDRARRGLGSQLQHQLRSAIQQGRLSSGSLLPPTRVLAGDLGVARSVVVEVYENLAAEGYLSGRQGSGTRVLQRVTPVPTDSRGAPASPAGVRLFGGLPDPALFPRAEWLRHYRAALTAIPNSELGYPGPLGALALRDALAQYVGRVRGVATSPACVVVTGGITQALVLLCRALRVRGVDAVAVEDPCFGFHREAIANTGMRTVPIPVDDDGLDVARLAAHDVGAVLVAPAHSYPTGAVLSAPRRAALVDWARRHDALVIEDDYDAEFRYDRAPIGALQGLAPDRVAYAGCVSKTLTPALRLGWIALPPWLVGEVVAQKLFDDMGTTMLEQLALAGFLTEGGLTRHLRRVRPIYRRRRDCALEIVATSLRDAVPTGVAAGLHLYVRLPHWCDEPALVDAARQRGLLIEGAGWHWASPASAPPALVLGYGAVSERALRDGLAVLGPILRKQQSTM